MTMVVNLEEIVDGMEAQGPESRAFLNLETGEVTIVNEFDSSLDEEDDRDKDDFDDDNIMDFSWREDIVRTIEDMEGSDDFIPLPDPYDIDEYNIMQRFIASIKDDSQKETLAMAIQGRGAFRRFKDKIYELDQANVWFKFRADALQAIAIDWCERNDLEYKT